MLHTIPEPCATCEIIENCIIFVLQTTDMFLAIPMKSGIWQSGQLKIPIEHIKKM